MIVAERAQAHDLDATIGLDREVGFDSEADLDARGILRIKAHGVDAADLRSPRVAHAGPGLNATCEGEIGAIGVRRAADGAANGEDNADQQGGGDNNEKADESLFAFRFH